MTIDLTDRLVYLPAFASLLSTVGTLTLPRTGCDDHDFKGSGGTHGGKSAGGECGISEGSVGEKRGSGADHKEIARLVQEQTLYTSVSITCGRSDGAMPSLVLQVTIFFEFENKI